MGITEEQLTEILKKQDLLGDKTIEELTENAHSTQTSLYDVLLERNVYSDEALGKMIADYLKIPFISLARIAMPPEVAHIIPERIARKFRAIAYGRDENGVKLATADPGNTDITQMIEKKTGEKVTISYATERDIRNAFYVYKKDLQKTYDVLLQEEIARTGPHLQNDAPVEKIVNMLIDYAYQDKASDIHIEAEEQNSLIRFRIDGILHDVLRVSRRLHDRLITRIKVLSQLRTDEHLTAQDGKMRLKLEEENLDIRVSIIPMVEGEKAVLRLLSSHNRQITLSDLGMTEKDLAKVKDAYSRSYGMILSTGPTGAGKSTSIYSVLKILNVREKNITTIEDPVEYRIKGLNQIQVNQKTGLTFAQGLRSILRQDPNIVFVGEIRDSETAGIAVNAALTGHLVLSTLHTNDSATALPRLIDMKIEPFLVASTVNVIIAQRLVRRICTRCIATMMIPEKDLLKNLSADLVKKFFGNKKDVQIYHGVGCKVCHMTGYNGRLGLFEVLQVTQNIRKLIIEKASSDDILKEAKAEGMTTMLEDGLQKVVTGFTSLEEVLRVTKIES